MGLLTGLTAWMDRVRERSHSALRHSWQGASDAHRAEIESRRSEERLNKKDIAIGQAAGHETLAQVGYHQRLSSFIEYQKSQHAPGVKLDPHFPYPATDTGPQAEAAFKFVAAAIKAKHPDIKLICRAPVNYFGGMMDGLYDGYAGMFSRDPLGRDFDALIHQDYRAEDHDPSVVGPQARKQEPHQP